MDSVVSGGENCVSFGSVSRVPTLKDRSVPRPLYRYEGRRGTGNDSSPHDPRSSRPDHGEDRDGSRAVSDLGRDGNCVEENESTQPKRGQSVFGYTNSSLSINFCIKRLIYHPTRYVCHSKNKLSFREGQRFRWDP